MKNLGKQFGHCLKEARLNKEFTQEELAFEANLDRTYISLLERGLKIPTLSSIHKISLALKISPIQLISNSFEDIETFSENKSSKKFNLNKNDKNKIQFFATTVSCGKPIDSSSNDEINKVISLDEYIIKKPEKTFFIKATGDSMTPIINDGDLLVSQIKTTFKNGQIVVASIDGNYTIKRFFNIKGKIKLTSENPYFQDIQFTEDMEVKVVAQIIAVIKLFN
jgi:DNA polymerase V